MSTKKVRRRSKISIKNDKERIDQISIKWLRGLQRMLWMATKLTSNAKRSRTQRMRVREMRSVLADNCDSFLHLIKMLLGQSMVSLLVGPTPGFIG
jgi:hypothetical protein